MKIARISDSQLSFSFYSTGEQFQLYLKSFLSSPLGQLYKSIPFDELSQVINLKEKLKGPQSIFSPCGKIGLMFLKSYTGLSDKRLIEQLNANYQFQFFCDVKIAPDQPLTNFKIVSEIRCELGRHLDIDSMQMELAKYWLPYLDSKGSITMDATCYESFIRYPTDVKLLWESVDWAYNFLVGLCKQLKRSRPRTKYRKWSFRYLSYSKMRRKTKPKRRSITRGLLKLLLKLIGEVDSILDNQISEVKVSVSNRERYSTIQTICGQQWPHFFDDVKPKNRIVSIDKPYIRPIVRGKEIKKTEFGAKVHNFQIDGISFVDLISFENFNEGTRLIETVFKAQRLTKTKVKVLGADKIYQTNKNRTFVSKYKIKTDFVPKGRKAKDEKQRRKLRAAITKERASRMEGSFGTEKQYYHLDKVRARSEPTEILWIFFGIHTANAVRMSRKMAHQKALIKQAA